MSITPLLQAVRQFLVENTCVQSSRKLDDCVSLMAEARAIQDFFEVPVNLNILDYEQSLLWMVFLRGYRKMCPYVDQFDSADERPAKCLFAGEADPGKALDLGKALDFVAEAYDLSHESLVSEHWCEEPDTSDDEDEN